MDTTTIPQFNGNPEMEMAQAFVRHTGCSMFLTGRAGTGKTTFLQYLKSNSHKQMVVTAPTGVAAINAGGVTLHSFFQLPFGPYIPGRESRAMENQRFFRFSKEKKQIIKGLDLLVIDEISMVRADLLDSVDTVLRRIRRSEEPFGGVQMLLIGDLFQLPPVAKPDEWEMLKDHYPSIYFFSSHALERTDFLTIELKKIYRQSDEKFIRLLNQVRENRLDAASVDVLNQCADKPLPDKGYITLTTHNRKADEINTGRLNRLDTTGHKICADVEGDFPESAFPTPDQLVLKKGAQVMFLKNDPNPEKRYYNGKIGRVSHISKNRVFVTDSEDPTFGDKDGTIEVKPVDWENITYRVNPEDQTIEHKVVGRFSQVPLKLAWAVTIHKSQGLTFDRAIVDAKDAFAQGQTYVALSRCRTLEGLVLSSPVPDRGVPVEPAVADFMAGAKKPEDLEQHLQPARLAYQQKLLGQCFDFSAMKGMFYYFIRLMETHAGTVRVAGLTDPVQLRLKVRESIFEVGEKFLMQLSGLMDSGTLPDEHPGICDRTAKAAGWFGEKIDDLFGSLLENGGVETDNKALKKQISNSLATLSHEIRVRRAGILSCTGGFCSDTYVRAVSKAGMAAPLKPAPAPDYTELDIAHPALFKSLKAWRADVARAQGIPAFKILHQKVLVQIAVGLPDSREHLAALKGVGPKTVEKYGDTLVELVAAYRKDHNITSASLPDPAPEADRKEGQASPGPDTKEISLLLFEKGMDAPAVAEERGLALTTVQGHLCHFIETGQLALDRLVDAEKQAVIEKAVRPGRSLKEMKEALGDTVSYGEIKAVLAHDAYQESTS